MALTSHTASGAVQTEATRMTCEVGVLSDQLESAERRCAAVCITHVHLLDFLAFMH